MRGRISLIVAIALVASVAGAQSWAEPGWLGVMLKPGTRGVKVKVVPDTPAEEAGLVDDDEVLAVDGTKTKNADELKSVVGNHRVGDEVVLEVQRGKKVIELQATLGRARSVNDIVRKMLMDRQAPDFDLEVVGGTGSGKFADYEGKVVVIEFFATWCKFCPLMHKHLASLQTKHKDDVVVVGIASDDKQKLENYLDPDYEPKVTKSNGQVIHVEPHHGPLGFRALHDEGEKVKRAYLDAWATFPTVVIIDRDGFVRDVAIGASSGATRQVDRAVERLIDDDQK